MKTVIRLVIRFACPLVVTAGSVVLLACSGKVASGKQVFQEQCGGCHNPDSSDTKVGPGLKGLFQHEKLITSGKKVSEASIRAQIDDGGNGMPSFDQMLNDNDKESLIAYLKTL